MKVLTDEDAKQMGFAFGIEARVVRIIESAVIKLLAAGVSVEPVAEVRERLSRDGLYTMKAVTVLPTGSGLFTTDQLTTAIAAARVAALKEVVALCDPDALGLEQGDDCATGVYRVEKAIRALKGGAA